MAGFDVIRHATYQEVVIEGPLTLTLVREILGEVTKPDNWLDLNALWRFGPEASPPAFHEFDDIVGMLDKLYMRRPTAKRVALLVPDSFSRSVADIFLGLAVSLPVQMRIFTEAKGARAWAKG